MTSATPSAAAASTSPAGGFLPGLDGMRAIAALSVLGFHSLWRTPSFQPAARVLGHGDIGVEVFFVLSGFLVARPLVRHAVAGGRPVPAVDFWRKRVARIWPAYLVALAGALAIGIGDLDGVGGAVRHVLLIHTHFDDRGGIGLRPAWTLVVEVAFYAVILPLAWLVTRAGRRAQDAWVVLCVALIAFGSWAIVVTSYRETEAVLRVLPPFLPAFAAGMLLAAAELDAGPRTWATPVLGGVRRLAARPWLCAGLAVGGLVAMVVLLPVNTPPPALPLGPERTAQSFIQTAVAALFLAPLALRTAAAGWLQHRALVALGVASFGFYLWHLQALRIVRPLLQGPLAAALLGVVVAVGLAFLAGEASRRWIEEPARRVLAPGGRR